MPDTTGDTAPEGVAAALSRVMADTYTLYLMTHNFHWNVTGPRFRALHLMFEDEEDRMDAQGNDRLVGCRLMLRHRGD